MEAPPLRKISHEQRVETAERICAKILERFSDNIFAVFIIGSTAKALDRPYSDLEMIAIVRDSVELPTRYYVHEGLLVQIDYRQESEFLKSAREPGREWPLGADEVRNRILLFERGNWTRKLVEAVRENDARDFADALRFAALGMTETLASVRNANYKLDHMDLRSAAYWMAMDAAKVVYLLNRKYVLTTSWYWTQVFECPIQPRDFKHLIDIVAGFVPSTEDQTVDGAERLWSETMSLVKARGITIESAAIDV